MKYFLLTPFLFLFLLPGKKHTVKCEIKTSLGNFVVELMPHNAPLTCDNFLKYADAGLYDNTDFFRVQNLQNQNNRPVKIEVIQGGKVDSLKEFPPIKHENSAAWCLVFQNARTRQRLTLFKRSPTVSSSFSRISRCLFVPPSFAPSRTMTIRSDERATAMTSLPRPRP